MFYKRFYLDSNGEVAFPLWNDYVEIDYGNKVPEKGYRGFRTYLADVTGADHINGNMKTGFFLIFTDEEKYLLFLMKYC